jgi:large subunit ribosomal protein L25
MSDVVTLQSQPRGKAGSSAAYQLRRQGLVPAIVYGHKEPNEAITVVAEDFLTIIHKGSRVVKLVTGKGPQTARIRELQWCHLGKDLLHADFQRVNEDERITVKVKVELRGTPVGLAGGGVLEQPIHTLAVECLAIAIPDVVRVNVNELKVGQAIHVKELQLPTGVTTKVAGDLVVAQVKLPGAEPVAALTDGAEPELIGRQKADKEEADDKK